MFRKKDKTTIQEEFPRKLIENSLNKLPWEYAENQKGKAWEVIKLDKVEEISTVLFGILSLIKKNQVYGEYSYYFLPNRIERTNPKKIKPKTKWFKTFKLSSPIKIRIKKKQTGGLVTKVE